MDPTRGENSRAELTTQVSRELGREAPRYDSRMNLRFHAPYLEWAKKRPSARFDLAGSNVLSCSIEDLPGAQEAIALTGKNDEGYAPLAEAIAARYGVDVSRVTTATGASGANFLVCAALLEPGDEVLVERPGYDPLLGAPRMFSAATNRVERRFGNAWAIDPDRVRHAMTPRTRLIVITSPHNPTGMVAAPETLDAVARIAEAAGAHVLVDEVYLDTSDDTSPPAATRSDALITTSSLTKSYGLSGLRCGWVLAAPAIAERIRRARDIVDGTGSIVAERLATLAFARLDQLFERASRLLRINATLAREFLRSRHELEYVEPPGGTIVFPRLQGVADAENFTRRLLAEYHTAVVPGRFFEAPAHFRLGFGGATEPLRGGLAAIGAALDARVWSR
jgi:aspartate/methionine/tyrosine aminotransferase